MMRFYKWCLLGSALLFGTAACTEVDDRLGETLLPGHQKMEVEVVSFTDQVETYLYRSDSLPSSRLGYAYLGQMTDPKGVFGAQTNSSLLQFLPISMPYTNRHGFGIDPIVDSMCILFEIDGVRGDSLQVQHFEIYNIVEGPEPIVRDSMYRASFDVEDYRGEKLFEFSHKGRKDVEARLFPTAAGKDFIDRIIRLDSLTYRNDSLFLEKFRGLYITPAPGSPLAAAIYSTDLENSGLRLHVRNHDTLDVTAIYDTITTLFTFNDHDITDTSTGITTAWDNVSINTTKFDYTGSVLGQLEAATDGFTDTSNTQSVTYVQTMGGVGTRLRFSDELITQLKALKSGDRDIMINQAMMHIWLEDENSTPALDAAVARLGSYMNLTRLNPIPDYQYGKEASYAAGGTAYKMPYGGYLNRSNARYEIDITSYIQQLADGKISPDVLLGPDAINRFGFGATALSGSGSERPITIRLTYTTIDR